MRVLLFIKELSCLYSYKNPGKSSTSIEGISSIKKPLPKKRLSQIK
jgi:hypothetical protein